MSVPAQDASARTPGSLRWLTAFAICAFAFLCALGVWQLQRLQWKEALIARIEARTRIAAMPLPPPDAWPALARADYEYTRVTARGVFDHAREALIFRAAGGGQNQPGYHVLTPLMLSHSGAAILVNRGYVPEALKAPGSRAAGQISGEVIVTGLLRAPEERSAFTPADDPARGLWYTRDPNAIARHAGLPNAAPFSIDLEASNVPGGWPRAGAAVIAIRNDHLAYAMTWFALAATLAAVFAAFVSRQSGWELRDNQDD